MSTVSYSIVTNVQGVAISAHSPYTYQVDVEWATTEEPYLEVVLECETTGKVATFRMYPTQRIAPTVTRYSFFFDQYLASFMDTFDDILNTDLVMFAKNMNAIFKIEVNGDGFGTSERFIAVHGVVQFGQLPTLENIKAGVQRFIQINDEKSYGYFFANGTTCEIRYSGDPDPVYTIANPFGFYRIETQNPDAYEVWVDGEYLYLFSIESKNVCSDNYVLKYLDRYGMYRFYNFNEYSAIDLETKNIGRIESIVYNVSQPSSFSSIGKKSTKRITLVADNISNDDQIIIEDIINSPIIYMRRVGEVNELVMESADKTQRIKRERGIITKLEIELEYPQYYTITR